MTLSAVPSIVEHVFVAALSPVEEGLRSITGALAPDELTAGEAAEAIKALARIELLAAGARVRLARRIEDAPTTACCAS